ncbi:carbohydrate-binding module family 1 protein, partial [Aureobasidium subglaciale EXF-2481]
MLLSTFLLAITACTSSAYAAQVAYAQCGGQGFTGDKTCVSGYTCVASNNYYSQCLPSANTARVSTSKTSVAPVSTSKAAGSGGSGSGTTYKASFTQYGSGDTFGSGNCNTKTTACGFYTSVSFFSSF